MPEPIIAGNFGLGAVNLPTGAGAPEPPILMGAGGGPAGFASGAPNWQFANADPLQVLQGLYGQNLSGNGVFVQGPAAAGGAGPADYWTRMDNNMGFITPSITIDAGSGGPANYPAPGQGGNNQGQSVLGRILGATPAGAIVSLLRGRFMQDSTIGRILSAMRPHQSWQQNAAGNHPSPPTAPAVANPSGPALFGFNPGQGGNTTRFDYGTGHTSRTPSTNPLYNTGGAWLPVANAPVDVRWAPNSGTGNFQADQATKSFELAGGYPGVPNRPGTPDSGPSRFYNGPMRFEGGVISPADVVPAANSAANSATKQALYQQAIQAVPMGPDGYSAGYVARLNQWIAQNLAGGGAGPQLPGITISGPPIG